MLVWISCISEQGSGIAFLLASRLIGAHRWHNEKIEVFRDVHQEQVGGNFCLLPLFSSLLALISCDFVI